MNASLTLTMQGNVYELFLLRQADNLPIFRCHITDDPVTHSD
ncbi:MAG: hypothetical protein BWY76_02558 [bacterium ADurb.Bin429]|nr:MAG: hypothetical protein BWY76_02558 [bacterium ADurb.Bin429]